MSTVFGSGNPNATNISPVAFLIDSGNNIYVSGWVVVTFLALTRRHLPVILLVCQQMAWQDLLRSLPLMAKIFTFIVLSQGMTNLLYATFMGQSGGVGEHVDGWYQ